MTLAEVVMLAVRPAILVGVVAVLNVARPHASAAQRHFFWMFALAGSLAMPIAAWRLPVVPIPVPRAAIMVSGQHVVEVRSAPAAPTRDERKRSPQQIPLSLVTWSIWLAGVLVSLVRVAAAHVHARRIVRAAVRDDRFTRLARATVLVSSDVEFTFSYGIRKPVIVLPEAARRWSADALRGTIRHENAHVARRDALWLALSQCALALYWWHPAIRYAARRAASDCERACDDAVVRAGFCVHDYGRHLLTSARSRSLPVASALLRHGESLKVRIAHLLDARIDHGMLSRRAAIAGLAAGLPTASMLAAVGPAMQREVPPTVAGLREAVVDWRNTSSPPLAGRPAAPQTVRVSRRAGATRTRGILAVDPLAADTPALDTTRRLGRGPRMPVPVFLLPDIGSQLARMGAGLARTSAALAGSYSTPALRVIHNGTARRNSSSERAAFLISIPADWGTGEGVVSAIYEEASRLESDDDKLDVIAGVAPLPGVSGMTQRPLQALVASLTDSTRRREAEERYLTASMPKRIP